jgi:hypothetical protein
MTLRPEERYYAVIEDNKIINVIVGVEEEIVMANPNRFIECTNGWDFSNGIDASKFFTAPIEV